MSKRIEKVLLEQNRAVQNIAEVLNKHARLATSIHYYEILEKYCNPTMNRTNKNIVMMYKI
jgi:hypothetical protein